MTKELEAAVRDMVAAWDGVKCQVDTLDAMQVNRATQALQDAMARARVNEEADTNPTKIERVSNGVCFGCGGQLFAEHWKGHGTGKLWWSVACQTCQIEGQGKTPTRAMEVFNMNLLTDSRFKVPQEDRPVEGECLCHYDADECPIHEG